MKSAELFIIKLLFKSSAFNLEFENPPSYKRILWDYSRADKVSVNRSIDAIDWGSLFGNRSVKFQATELNDLLFNIYSCHIPDKIVLCDD